MSPDSTDDALSSELHHALEHARHHLPAQGPIGVFIHHNTLHALQHLPFHQALEEAEVLYGAQTYFSEPHFRSLYASGRITDRDLKAGLREAPAGCDPQLLSATLLFPLWEAPVRAEGSDALERAFSAVPTHVREKMTSETVQWMRELLNRLGVDWTLTDLAAALGGSAVRDQVHAYAKSCGRSALPSKGLGLKADRSLRYRALLAASASMLKVSEQSLWEAEIAVAGELLCGLFEAPCHLPRFEKALSSFPERIAVRALYLVCGALPLRAPSNRSTPAEVQSEARSAELANPFLIRWTAAFLDQGVSSWSWPHREGGLYKSVVAHVVEDGAPLPRWLSPIRSLFRQFENAEGLVLHLLSASDEGEEKLSWVITRRLLALPGWAGMVSRLEKSNEIQSPAPTLMDFLALRLAVDHLAEQEVHRKSKEEVLPESSEAAAAVDEGPRWQLFVLAAAMGWPAPTVCGFSLQQREEWLERIRRNPPRMRKRIWQEAYEHHYREQVLNGIAQNLKHPLALRQPKSPSMQIAFCIDDREEAIHRHLEELDPSVETLAVAGFFGVAMAYKGLDDAETASLCPVVVTPAHEIHEQPADAHLPLAHQRRARRRMGTLLAHHVEHGLRGLWRSTLLVFLQGAWALWTLPLRVLSPAIAAAWSRAVSAAIFPIPRTQLTLERRAPDAAVESVPPGARPVGGGLPKGFTVAEMADRVTTTLQNLGIAKRLSPLVVLLGHGASTSNNPHQSAYDCGACGGRHGGASARLFAQMANHPKVREELASRGLHVPPETTFVGGLHNTTTDEITLFDLHLLSPAALAQVRSFERLAEQACALSAQERCRRFESAPKNPTPLQALHHVRERAVDLSQARPELGHVTNAACVVGRRSLTRGLFLDRRAFLVSYDPFEDTAGAILERLLVAVGPVGAGINLEYYFSCVDNARFGCGTKLPHNLTGLLGVMDGAQSDLRTGLPQQMIEIHEPMRLLIVVEAAAEVLTAICGRQPGVAELVQNDWVQLVSVHPFTQQMSRFTVRGWERCDPQPVPLKTLSRSAEYYGGQSDFLQPALVLNQPGEIHVA